MIVNIPKHKSDDPAFATALNGMLANIVESHRPGEVHFIRIDRWFDHKWLGYSGYARVGSKGHPFHDTAIRPTWRTSLTFPPFLPNRVLQQTSFKWLDGAYQHYGDARPVHRPGYARSEQNLQNRVAEFTTSGLFVWFSSGTANVNQASIMAYAVDNEVLQAWFIGLRKGKDRWAVHQVKGIDRDLAVSWFPPGNMTRRI